jgi:hypothetical protein
MANKTVSVQVGPGFLGILTIVFITLKLTGYITWSWLWVLSPLWGVFAVASAIFAIAVLIAYLFDK